MKSAKHNGTAKAAASEAEIARLSERLRDNERRQRERRDAKGQTLTPEQEMNLQNVIKLQRERLTELDAKREAI